MFQNNKSIIAQHNEKISDVINKINKNRQGLCFIEKKGVLSGICTDGDIRRSLLKGFNLRSQVSKILKKNFISFNYKTPTEVIQNKISNSIKIIPLVDSKGKLVDYVSYNKLRSIPQYEPSLIGNELLYLKDCIKNGWISSRGKYVSNFENLFMKFTGCKNALSTSSCTTALHLSLLSFNIKKGDEVIVPNYTFASPINSIIHTGAKPIIADINYENLSLSLELIKSHVSNKTKAIIVVHTYGHAAEIDKIAKFAKRKNIKVIEDCAEALGTYYKKKHVGIFGDAATFSFFGNKTISTGEGGMLIFKSKKKYLLAKKLRDHGMSTEKKYWQDLVGYNYRITNLQAAVGQAQLEKVNIILKRKRWIARKYIQKLKNHKFIDIPAEDKNTKNSYWLFYVILKEEYQKDRDKIINFLLKSGIEARNGFYCFNQMKIYKKYKSKNLVNSE